MTGLIGEACRMGACAGVKGLTSRRARGKLPMCLPCAPVGTTIALRLFRADELGLQRVIIGRRAGFDSRRPSLVDRYPEHLTPAGHDPPRSGGGSVAATMAVRRRDEDHGPWSASQASRLSQDALEHGVSSPGCSLISRSTSALSGLQRQRRIEVVKTWRLPMAIAPARRSLGCWPRVRRRGAPRAIHPHQRTALHRHAGRP